MTETIADARAASYEIAQTLAPTWERRRAEIEEVTAPLRAWLVRELAAQPGETVLELAAGAGDTGFEVAAIVGERGRLLSTDFSPAMLEVARRRGAELGLENVDFRVIDAERIELEDDCVDGVVCRFGFMLMSDPAAALAETRRVLRPGGRLVLAVWGPPERNPFFAVAGRALVERGHLPAPVPGAPGVFSLGDEQRLRALVEGAGFAAVRTEGIPVGFAVPSIEEYLATAADTAGPIALVLRALPTGERDQLAGELERAFAPFRADDGYRIPGLALAAVAS
ncbi:MAG TPA: class I SAM-dependent methyltransferase [Gaiellaceae bacterium]|nr:class I SAM-dependent methyltransferase [Gaiellaceae bacterium]